VKNPHLGIERCAITAALVCPGVKKKMNVVFPSGLVVDCGENDSGLGGKNQE
jgi:hypothetical protein